MTSSFMCHSSSAVYIRTKKIICPHSLRKSPKVHEGEDSVSGGLSLSSTKSYSTRRMASYTLIAGNLVGTIAILKGVESLG